MEASTNFNKMELIKSRGVCAGVGVWSYRIYMDRLLRLSLRIMWDNIKDNNTMDRQRISQIEIRSLIVTEDMKL